MQINYSTIDNYNCIGKEKYFPLYPYDLLVITSLIEARLTRENQKEVFEHVYLMCSWEEHWLTQRDGLELWLM